MTDYSTTNFKGKKYMLTQEAYWNAGTQMYQASAEDEEGNVYMAYFGILEGHEDDEFEDAMCDWDHATDIEKLR